MNEPVNPYTPPKSNVELIQDARPIVSASKGRRFGTLITDYACYFALSVCLGAIIGLVFGEKGIEMLQSIPDMLLGAILLLIYYVSFEGILARTPGKLIFGTIVVNDVGVKPNFKQVIGRTLCRFIPFEVFSGLSDRPWHDSITDTYVVLAKREVSSDAVE